ncbi:hypothetical protein AVEN_120448-1 [Araneus ventricosus]|uniref:Uncharacterized protein n=1 Tax=Araneus ventricosus TaxID=182803 RepID=A0A4Y2MCC9_ARAVE|nr:hypothetical protein AVEN_120448-1 [Araneus ventricosus]
MNSNSISRLETGHVRHTDHAHHQNYKLDHLALCLVVKMLDSGPKGHRFKSTYCHSGDEDKEQELSFPLLDGITKNQIPLSATADRWQHQKSYSKQLSHFKVYDAYHSTKTERAWAQTIGAAICAYASSTRKYNYRFLDIEIISNKLGFARVVHRAAQSYSDVSIHLRTGNSF